MYYKINQNSHIVKTMYNFASLLFVREIRFYDILIVALTTYYFFYSAINIMNLYKESCSFLMINFLKYQVQYIYRMFSQVLVSFHVQFLLFQYFLIQMHHFQRHASVVMEDQLQELVAFLILVWSFEGIHFLQPVFLQLLFFYGYPPIRTKK